MNNKMKFIKNIFFIIIILLLLGLLIFLYNEVYDKLLQKKNFENDIISFAEKNKETIFSINKIVFFSSSDSKIKTGSESNFTIENLYTYTDIALFIDNGKEINDKNTLKNLKMINIKFTKVPKLGIPNLYFKSINDFTNSEIKEENIIDEKLDYLISVKEIDLNTPVLYNNCANPITISYINQNIKSDYTMIDTAIPITYNGELLKRCNVELEEIESSISFEIEIENNINQKFRTTVTLEIPYKNQEKTIYDGSITIEKNADIKFYRYE